MNSFGGELLDGSKQFCFKLYSPLPFGTGLSFLQISMIELFAGSLLCLDGEIMFFGWFFGWFWLVCVFVTYINCKQKKINPNNQNKVKVKIVFFCCKDFFYLKF